MDRFTEVQGLYHRQCRMRQELPGKASRNLHVHGRRHPGRRRIRVNGRVRTGPQRQGADAVRMAARAPRRQRRCRTRSELMAVRGLRLPRSAALSRSPQRAHRRLRRSLQPLSTPPRTWRTKPKQDAQTHEPSGPNVTKVVLAHNCLFAGSRSCIINRHVWHSGRW